ncbi:MAG TPA: YhbY family RNA-binding protein [Candidatus Desulfobacillus sp.]|nr:YhbY family RNA-binding protein [Candidatus Desulfobacillus sp.]
MTELTAAQRRDLRARAHGLRPVASISRNELSEAVLAEIERSLKAHELVKVRVYGHDRGEREGLLDEVCRRLAAAPVQHIGNVLVLYRKKPDDPAPAAAPRQAATRRRRR